MSGSLHAQDRLPEVNFVVTREGDLIQTEASVDLPVALDRVWAVLTDYEGYPRFISGMDESRIVSRSAEGVVVEQKGRFGFLFFSQAIESRILVSEHPPHAIDSKALDGDFRVMAGRYELSPVGDKVRLSYSGRMIPRFELLPVFGLSIVRHILLRNFREMLDEIIRRDAVSKSLVLQDP
ncbi:MAG: SRPBCC family protein [Propionivibrio sp.]